MGDLLEKGFVTMAMTRARKGLVVVGELAKLNLFDSFYNSSGRSTGSSLPAPCL